MTDMAQNFEIIFNQEEPVTLLDGTKHQFNKKEIMNILKKHNCKWIFVSHPVDDMSHFLHWHLGIHTDANNEYATIGKWFNLPANSVQKIMGKFESTYALYLIHYDKVGKTPIDPKMVESNFELDYDKLITKIEAKKKDDEILNRLAEGYITEYDLYKEQSAEWCRKHKYAIDVALQVRSKKFQVGENKRNMEVVYITGEARTGKSHLAVKMAEDQGMSYYFTSNGKNPFDDYMGQEAVILDDIRPSDFKFSDLLKVLDNHMSSKVSARYHNIDLNCKVMYMTTILPIDEFYKNIQESTGEATEQLKGRIGMLIKVHSENMEIFTLNPNNRDYDMLGTMPNPILADENIEKMTQEERQKKAIEMLKGLGEISLNLAEKIEGFQPITDSEDEQIFGQQEIEF